MSAQGFDLATIIKATLDRQNQSKDQGSFSRYFKTIEQYQGVTGKVSFNDYGEIEREFVVVKLTPRGLQQINLNDQQKEKFLVSN